MSEIDETDMAVIRELQREGSQTNLAIAERLQVSEATIRRRRARLEQEGYVRLVGSANPVKLGYEVVAIVGLNILTSKILEVESALKRVDEIHFMGITTGNYDIMLEVWLRSNQDVVRFVTEVLGVIDGIVKSDVFQFIRLSKYYSWTGVLLGNDG